jgi:hypothetical protein
MSDLDKQRDLLERRARVEQSRLMRTMDALAHHELVHAAVERLNPSSRPARQGRPRWQIVLVGAIAGLAAFAVALGIERIVARRRRAIS